MTIEEMRKIVWNEALKVSIDMQYSKSKYLQGKYDAIKTIWEALGGDKPTQTDTKG